MILNVSFKEITFFLLKQFILNQNDFTEYQHLSRKPLEINVIFFKHTCIAIASHVSFITATTTFPVYRITSNVAKTASASLTAFFPKHTKRACF